mmetsp:Transcript_59981/g.190521  ORF Transcript_59981/g.190521 Transcript_59981/m.190521 type:complete len:291 (+) Transcript_59981:1903-2775(+)
MNPHCHLHFRLRLVRARGGEARVVGAVAPHAEERVELVHPRVRLHHHPAGEAVPHPHDAWDAGDERDPPADGDGARGDGEAVAGECDERQHGELARGVRGGDVDDGLAGAGRRPIDGRAGVEVGCRLEVPADLVGVRHPTAAPAVWCHRRHIRYISIHVRRKRHRLHRHVFVFHHKRFRCIHHIKRPCAFRHHHATTPAELWLAASSGEDGVRAELPIRPLRLGRREELLRTESAPRELPDASVEAGEVRPVLHVNGRGASKAAAAGEEAHVVAPRPLVEPGVGLASAEE